MSALMRAPVAKPAFGSAGVSSKQATASKASVKVCAVQKPANLFAENAAKLAAAVASTALIAGVSGKLAAGARVAGASAVISLSRALTQHGWGERRDPAACSPAARSNPSQQPAASDAAYT